MTVIVTPARHHPPRASLYVVHSSSAPYAGSVMPSFNHFPQKPHIIAVLLVARILRGYKGLPQPLKANVPKLRMPLLAASVELSSPDWSHISCTQELSIATGTARSRLFSSLIGKLSQTLPWAICNTTPVQLPSVPEVVSFSLADGFHVVSFLRDPKAPARASEKIAGDGLSIFALAPGFITEGFSKGFLYGCVSFNGRG
jgi:hypothetical protein